MEHDSETIIHAFNQLLLSHSKPLLTPSQQAVLDWCLRHSHGTYKAMAADSHYTYNSLRDAGCQLFAIIRSVLGKRVKKSTCGKTLREWYQQKSLIENTKLIGREADLQTLLDAITLENRRIICISGPPRIGKTYLARRLQQQLLTLNLFDILIEGHGTQLPTVEALHQFVLTSIGGFPSSSAGLPPAAALTALLGQHRLLLILDKTEVLQQPEALGGAFRDTSKGYEHWFRSLLDRYGLSSCVILLCRVPPRCLQTSHDLVFHHPLKGLSGDAAKCLLQQQGLQHFSPQQLDHLGRFCGYSPGVLAALAHKLVHSGNRNLEYILHNPLATFHADDDLWQEALDDLTSAERELMGWLRLYPDAPVKWENDGLRLNGQLARNLETALQALYNRGMVDVDPVGLYFVSTDWLRHVVQHNLLIELAQALTEQDIQALNRYPLIEPKAPQWRRQEQWQALLGRLPNQLEQINPSSWTTQFRLERINAMLNAFHSNPQLQEGFGVGNLLNVAVALNVPLSSLHLSRLTIRNADFWTAPWRGVNLQECRLVNTLLPVVLRGNLTAVLSPNGTVIAVGDEEGRVLCWRSLHNRFELFRHAKILSPQGHSPGITQLSFGAEDMLAIGAGQEVYRWWLGTPQTEPTWLMSVSASITSLACGGDEYVAAGLQNGCIMVWYEPLESTMTFKGHSGPVRELVANLAPYSNYLASRGFGERVLLWQVGKAEIPQQEIRPERHMFFAIAWAADELVTAAYVDSQFLIRIGDGTAHPLPFQESISGLKFSPRGDTLAVLKKNVVEIQQLTTSKQVTSIPYTGQLQTLAVCNHGAWILTVEQDKVSKLSTVRVWDVDVGQLCWELKAYPLREPEPSQNCEITLNSCQGLSDTEKAYWQGYRIAI